MTFEAPGGPYTMKVEKGRNMSQMRGDGWGHFISHMGITSGDLISFSFGAERPKLAVIFVNTEEDDEDPLNEALYAQRIRLSEAEVCNLWDIIPPRADFVGVPFVTRLTSTMVDRPVMVCYTYCSNFIICFFVILANENYLYVESDDMHSVESNDMLSVESDYMLT